MPQPARTIPLAASLVLAFAGAAQAATGTNEVVVHETTTSVEIELTPETVLCSAADYSALFLKVLIPELANITLLDHQNTDVGAPCVAAGLCQGFGGDLGGLTPSDILRDDYLTETVDIRVRAVRNEYTDDVAGTCITSMTETVDLTIRGVPFTHERFVDLGGRPISDCIDAGGDTGKEDSKSDNLGKSNDDATAGGCSAAASGGSGGLGVALFLCAALAFRRRRSPTQRSA